eukprot:13396896-Ditylum_brightwellii.AAC.1
MGIGMALYKAELYNEDIRIGPGETTGANYKTSIKALVQVISHVNEIAGQREKVLKMLKHNESDTW